MIHDRDPDEEFARPKTECFCISTYLTDNLACSFDVLNMRNSRLACYGYRCWCGMHFRHPLDAPMHVVSCSLSRRLDLRFVCCWSCRAQDATLLPLRWYG